MKCRNKAPSCDFFVNVRLTDLNVDIYKTVNTYSRSLTVRELLLLTARTKRNFQFVRTANIFTLQVTNRLKNMSTFFNILLFFFVVNSFMNVYCLLCFNV